MPLRSRCIRSLISVVVPTLNEATCIRRTLESIACQEPPLEIVVVDGGSLDATVEIASGYGRTITTDRGRASQMNAGASVCRGDILLFLHADTQLPEGALESVRDVIAGDDVASGTFRLRFDRETPLLRFYSACTRLRTPLLCFGDRGLFVRREVFRAVGGFPSVPIFEDLELARHLFRRHRFAFLDAEVTTSARRFLRAGPLRQQIRNAVLWSRYLAGADPLRLARHYPYLSTSS